MTLISGVSGLIGAFTQGVLGSQGRNAGASARTDDDANERAANMRRQSESLDAQSGRWPDNRGSDRGGLRTGGMDGPRSSQGPSRGDGWGGQKSSSQGPGFEGYGSRGVVPTAAAVVDRVTTALANTLGARTEPGRGPQAPTQPSPSNGPGNGHGNGGPAGPIGTAPSGGQTGPQTGPQTGSGPQSPGATGPGTPSAPGTGAPATPGPVTAGPASPNPATPGATAPTPSGPTNPAAVPTPQTPAQAAATAALQTAQAAAAQSAVNPPQPPGAQPPASLTPVAQQPGAATPPPASTAPTPSATPPSTSAPSVPATPGAPSATPTPTIVQTGLSASLQPTNVAPPALIGQSSIVVAAQAQGDPAFAPVAPINTNGARGAAEAIIARHVAAIAQAERADGPGAAARELRARTRDLPAGSAAEVLADSRPQISRAVESMASNTPLDRIERIAGALEKPASGRIAADISSALDAGAMHGQGAHVTREVAQAIANAERMTAERLLAFGQGIAFGTGIALPLALIDAYRERRDDTSAKLLEAALVDGLERLLKRLTDAVTILARRSGPIAFDWSAWRAAGLSSPDAETRLRAKLSGEPGLLEEIDAALDAVDSAGLDAVNALERLSRWGGRSPEIIETWRAAAASPALAFAIAQSIGAQHIVVQRLAPSFRSEPPGSPESPVDRDAARKLYAAFGFGPERAEVLADATLARHAAVQMGGGWMRSRRARDRDSEAAFARLVAYLEGQGVPANRYVETIGLADLDPDGERPETLFGAPMMARFELDLTARDVTPA